MIGATRPNMLSEHCWCAHLREMFAHQQTYLAPGLDREHNVVKEHGSRIQAPDCPRNGLAREVFRRMRRRRLRGEVAAEPTSDNSCESRVILIPECFPRGRVVVQHLPKRMLAALDDRRIVQRREVCQ